MGHPEPDPVEIEPVEFQRVIFDGAVAARGDIVNDGANRRFNVRRGLALGVEKRAKTLREIGGAGVETNRHGGDLCEARETLCGSMARRGRPVNIATLADRRRAWRLPDPAGSPI